MRLVTGRNCHSRSVSRGYLDEPCGRPRAKRRQSLDRACSRFVYLQGQVDLDGNARLLIPKDLLEYSGIRSEVVMASAVDIIEIWDKAAYERSLKEGADNFGDLAEEVMGAMQFGGGDVS